MGGRLLVLAIIGNIVPGGLFLYWLAHDYTSLAAALSDRLALAFFIDLLLSTFFLGYLFALKPLGRIKWYWFVAMSILGTLAFSIPFFVWLNWRLTAPRPAFRDWWREV